MSDFNNTDLQSHFDENGYIAINPLFSDNKIEEIKIIQTGIVEIIKHRLRLEYSLMSSKLLS